MRAVQDYRKKLDLPIEKRITLVLHADEELTQAITSFDHVLRENVLVTDVIFGKEATMEEVDLAGKTLGIHIAE